MKKLLLASAVAALSVTAAQAAPQVYGKVFLTADYNDGSGDETVVDNATGVSTTTKGDNNSTFRLNSNASRIGVKGGEKLTANTDLVYQLEYRVNVDDSSAQFTSRDTYLGLSNKQYGTVLAGRLSAIDGMIDYANVTAGGVVGNDGVLASFDSPRVNNAVAYVSPTYNDVTFMAMYGNDADQDAGSLPGGGWGVGAKYEPAGQPFRAGATYIHASKMVDSAIRVSGAYDINPTLTVGALYQLTDYDSNDNENAFTISAEHKTLTPWTAYAQVDVVDNLGGASNAEAQRLVVGGKYGFNKATTGHVYGGYSNAKTVTNNGVTTTTTDSDGFGIGAGIEYKF